MSSVLGSTNHAAPSVLSTSPAAADEVKTPDPEVVERPVWRRFNAAYKQRILAEADAALGTGTVGRILRREGLYSSQLAKWRKVSTCI